jgi:hypothetical protein
MAKEGVLLSRHNIPKQTGKAKCIKMFCISACVV